MAEAVLDALAGSRAAAGIASRRGNVDLAALRVTAQGSESRQVERSDVSPFQSLAWAAVAVESYGFRPVELALDVGRDARPFLPLMEINSPLTGRRGVSLPFSDFCAPAGCDEGGKNELIRSALEIGLRRGWPSTQS